MSKAEKRKERREERFVKGLFVLLGVSLFPLPSSLFAVDSPSVRATVTPAQGQLGELVTLEVTIEHPLSLIVESPAFTKTLGAFEIHSSTRLPVQIQNDRATDHFQAQLQAFTTGHHHIPAIEIPLRDAMGAISTVKTPELKVLIEVVPPGPKDKGDIRGIKGVVGPTAWSIWWWVCAAVLLSALSILIWRKRQRALSGPPPPPPIPPDEDALAKLRALEESGLLEAGKFKEFFSGVSDILRGYLEAGFDTPALERTTFELMRELRRRSLIPAERQVELKEILETCDLVKFAKWKPPIEEAQGTWSAAVKWVEATRRTQ